MAALVAAAALTGCQKDETVTGYGGADKVWGLESMDGESFDAQASLSFPEPGKIAGQAPCNSFSATQGAPYPWIEIGPVAATRMACPEMAAEQAFFDALDKMSLVEVAGDTMILSNDAGRQMVFTAQ